MSDPIPFAGVFSEGEDRPLVFAGLPDDSRSSFLRGPAAAPARIRAAYDGRCYNATTESEVDLRGAVTDLGDLPSGSSWEETARTYRTCAEEQLRAGKIPFFAGGDHAVSVPIFEALAVLERPVHLVHVDAHPDLYPELDGDPHSHACMAARALEMPHIVRVTQLGIRTMNATQREIADGHGDRYVMLEAMQLEPSLGHPPSVPEGALVYLTIDMDGIDPAFAPGVSHPVPGGLTSRQVLDLIRNARWELCGMDVVELNPERDEGDRTAVLAGRILHEGMGYAARQLG